MSQVLKLPERLLEAFAFTPAEQDFAARAYRTSPVKLYAFHMVHPAVDSTEWWGSEGRHGHSTHLPLLRLIAEEDENIEALEVGGKKVAYFPYRRKASALVAQITGQEALYRGLQDEEIRSNTTPRQPYPEQDRLIARLVLSRLQRFVKEVGHWTNLTSLERRLSYMRAHVLNEATRDLCDESEFGTALVRAIKAEAAQKRLLERFEHLRYYYPWNPGSFGE